MNNYHIKQAFTLAEVLLTLAIIGIVAALTIPALMQNIQDMDTVARLRKAQSAFQQAITMYMAQSGVTDLRSSGLFEGANADNAWNAFTPYLITTKNCGTSGGLGCYPPGITYKFLNGTPHLLFDFATGHAKAVLNDGTVISLSDLHGGNCNEDLSLNHSGPLLSVCAGLDMDINGHRPPNQYGRDFFSFLITANGTVYPRGMEEEFAYGCSPTGTSTADDGYAAWGFNCTAKVLKEGKINY